jgi:hypothetical protein
MNGKPKFLCNWSILIMTVYTVAYAVYCGLATKQQQQPGDIAVDSDVLPNPKQLPPDLTIDNDKDAQKQEGSEASTS